MVYHEKQSLQLCAVHAINNVFQDRNACSKQQLDSICLKLHPSTIWNNHRSALRLGNYDVNVIMVFLNERGYDVIWFDKRKPVSSIDHSQVFGFLLNDVYPITIFGQPVGSLSLFKHWFAVRKLDDGVYFNLDSKLDCPTKIGNEEAMQNYLVEATNSQTCQLLLIVKKREEENPS